MRRRSARLFVLAVAVGAPAGDARAADLSATWTGAAGNWTTASNWSSSPQVPNNGGGDTWTATVVTSAAEISLDAPITLDQFLLFDGRLNTTGNPLTLTDHLQWNGGDIIGTGSVSVATSIALDGGPRRLSAVTINALSTCTTSWLTGQIDQTDVEGGVFNNAGTFNDLTDDSWVWLAQQTPVFNNTGTYNKLIGSALSNKEVEAQFNNSGVVNITAGDLWLSGGGDSSGTFNVAFGTRLILSDFAENFSGAGAVNTTLLSTSHVNAPGEVFFSNLFGNAVSHVQGTFDAALLTVDPGIFGEVWFDPNASLNNTIVGNLDVRSGRLMLNTLQAGGAEFSALDFSGGRIEGGDEVFILNGMTWTGGTIAGANQTFEVFNGLTISGSGEKLLVERAFYNVGDAVSSGGTLSLESSDVINSVGSTWEVSDEMDVVDAGGLFTSRYFNDGEFTKTGSSTITSFAGVEFNNTGTVTVAGGVLALGGGGTSDGSFNISAAGELRFEGTLQHFLDSGATISGPVGSRLVFMQDSQSASSAGVNVDLIEVRDTAYLFSDGVVNSIVTAFAPAAADDVSTQIGGGTWTAGSFMQIGAFGRADLQMGSGAFVSGTVVDMAVLGAASRATVGVTSGAALHSASFLRIGNEGQAVVGVSAGATLSADQQIVLGAATTGFGSLTAAGTTTLVSAGAFVTAGDLGRGEIGLSGGARLTAGGIVFLGSGTSSTGNVVVESGAAIDSMGQLVVGGDGTGVVGIFGGSITSRKGASGTNTAVLIGRRGSGIGTVTVDGANSRLDAIDGHLVVGFGSLTAGDTAGGRGNLFIRNAGLATSINGYIGRNAGGIGTVTIGNNGTWTMSGTLYVGGNDTAAGGIGRIFLTGGAVRSAAARLWNNGAIFYSGGTFETGTLTLVNGGQISTNVGGGTTTIKSAALDMQNPTISRIDLFDDRMIIDFTAASPLASILPLVQIGYNNGNWTGNGITSTSAQQAAATSTKTGIGYVEATDIFSTFPASFGGYTVDATSVLISYTLLGDATLDRTVSIADFALLGANFNLPSTWNRGDFNYDGVTGIGDFALLAANFNKAVPAESARPGAVPEPALGVAIIGAALLSARRRWVSRIAPVGGSGGSVDPAPRPR